MRSKPGYAPYRKGCGIHAILAKFTGFAKHGALAHVPRMVWGSDERAVLARVGFDAVISLSQDILEAHRLHGRGRDAEVTARIAVERLPGIAMVRVQWHGPQPGGYEPSLVTIFPLGSAAPRNGPAWLALQDMAGELVREAFDRLARQRPEGEPAAP